MLSLDSSKTRWKNESFKKIVVSLPGQLFDQTVSNSCFLVAVSYRDRVSIRRNFCFFVFFLSSFLFPFTRFRVLEKDSNSLGFVRTVSVRSKIVERFFLSTVKRGGIEKNEAVGVARPWHNACSRSDGLRRASFSIFLYLDSRIGKETDLYSDRLATKR